MGISRKLPVTNTSRLQTLKKAQSKVTNPPASGNILSDTTTTRLATCLLNYKNGTAAIITAIRAQRKAIKLAIPQRILLRDICNSYVKSINNGIKIKLFIAADRTLLGLNSGNGRLPKLKTDQDLLDFADLVISSDAERILDGGAVMPMPTIASFIALHAIAAPIIIAVSNAKTVLTDAKTDLNNQNSEIDDCIVHIWGEVEMYYSKYEPSAKRAACRLWSVRYLSKGEISLVTGKITDSVTGLGKAGVRVRITGGKAVSSDSDGNFSINTSMYGDLELTATLAGYLDGSSSFIKEDGIPMVENLELVAE